LDSEPLLAIGHNEDTLLEENNISVQTGNADIVAVSGDVKNVSPHRRRRDVTRCRAAFDGGGHLGPTRRRRAWCFQREATTQLRTVQRLVKAWRGRTARLLIDGEEATLASKFFYRIRVVSIMLAR
jgi:hypothetical protein